MKISLGKKVAITGGRGRLAPRLRDALEKRGCTVTMFSRTAEQGFRGIDDLTNAEVLASYDAILHLGWSTVPLLAEENPGIEERNDFPLMEAIGIAAEKCDQPPQLIFSSTAAVYGNTGERPAEESFPCQPIGRYAKAKLKAEALWANLSGSCILRISNVFSPGCEKTRPQGIIPILLDSARSGKRLTIWGDGNAVKDYIAIADLCAAITQIVEARLAGIYNLASEHVYSVNELIALVEDACGHRIPVDHAPHYPWDVERGVFSSQKLQTAIGWKPLVIPSEEIYRLAKDKK